MDKRTEKVIDQLIDLSASYTDEAWMAAGRLADEENIGGGELADYIDHLHPVGDDTEDSDRIWVDRAELFEWALGIVSAREECRRRYGFRYRR